jgi:cell division protein FtsN
MLYNGDGVMRDWPRAYALIVRSAASGSPRASEVQAQMDQYIPADDRQKGLILAREYEAEAQRPQLPPEIAGQGSQGSMRGTDLPPSSYAQNGGTQPAVEAPRPERPRPVVVARPVRTEPAPPVVQAPTRASQPATGRWRIQFGAFRDEGNARALWAKLHSQVSALSGLEPYFLRTGGALTKLQAGPLTSSTEAGRICASVKPTGTPCVPVAP